MYHSYSGNWHLPIQVLIFEKLINNTVNFWKGFVQEVQFCYHINNHKLCFCMWNKVFHAPPYHQTG